MASEALTGPTKESKTKRAARDPATAHDEEDKEQGG